MRSEAQRQRCCKNIKLGDTFLMRDQYPPKTFEATIIGYALSHSTYLIGTNHQSAMFWTIANFPESVHQYSPKLVPNFNDYQFAWWYESFELEQVIIKRIK